VTRTAVSAVPWAGLPSPKLDGKMPEETKSFDLLVIGGGPAGIVGATTAAAFGKTVALVDNHPELGGAGANTGTVPSKTLRETALALSGMKSRDLYGVDLSLRREATVSDFLHHERNVKDGLNHFLSQRLAACHSIVYRGSAEFKDPHTIRVKLGYIAGSAEILLKAEHILIATGSSPVHPPGFPFGSREVYDSDTILDIDRLPGTMAIIGCGAIGSEYACTFAALGTNVHLIDGRDTLLPFLDGELSRALLASMEGNGILFHWNEQVSRYDPHPSGGLALKLHSGGTLHVDAVLIATGRKSNVDGLNLDAAGIVTGEHGVISVDDYYRTNVPHILAAGDVIGFPALASTGMEQARRAVRHAFNGKLSSHASRLLPTGVYTIPEVSMAGETEESLKHAGVDYVAGRASYGACARGRIIGDSNGFLKLLFRRADMKLLGVHVIGEQATELVHVGLIALLAEASVAVFDEVCFNIPTLSELYKVAALNALSTMHP
jgi:NAD(P) transhydrogenase